MTENSPTYNWNVNCEEFIPRSSICRPTAVIVPVHHQESPAQYDGCMEQSVNSNGLSVSVSVNFMRDRLNLLCLYDVHFIL